MSLPVNPPGLNLFDLLPAVYRTYDMQLAQSLPLLNIREQATLAQLKLLTAPGMPALAADQQALLDELNSKASRGPLQSLLLVMQEQISIVANDLDQLYDDQFIETCAEWVIPYIGDLIGYQSVHGINAAIDNPRSEVANTIAFRRRKGTVLVMEELARDATGWGAHAVEFFRILGDTQYMNHIRRHSHYAPDLRKWKPGLYINTGFDRTAHKVDVRRVGAAISSAPREHGKYNLQNIGIFLWSMGAWRITECPATPSASADGCYRFSSLGMDNPLFHKATPPGFEPDDTNINDPAKPFNVADRLRRRVLCDDLQRGVGARYYGETSSLVVSLNGTPLDPYQTCVCDLAGPDGAWANTPVPATYAVAIDPELGRLALPVVVGTPPPAISVSYEYGFNADLGGGEYPRAIGPNGFLVTDPAWVLPFPDTEAVPRYIDLQGAVDFASAELAENALVAVEIAGSGIVTAGPLTLHLPAGTTLEVRAAEGARPTLLLDGEISITGDASSTLLLHGLLIAGATALAPATPAPIALVHAPMLKADGTYSRLGQLKITHCTLVPGWSVTPHGEPVFPNQATLLAEPAGLQVTVARSILGPVRCSRTSVFTATDSILDAASPTSVAYMAPDSSTTGPSGGALTLVGCTVIGKIHATLFSLISDSILWSWCAPADDPKIWPTSTISDRRQAGCVRFSYLPTGAITPRRFQCVEKAPNNPQPLFFDLRFGRPGYCKLLASTSDRIRRGAEDSGEIGVFHYLLNPQREADLRVRMQEYLPVAMEVGLIYQN